MNNLVFAVFGASIHMDYFIDCVCDGIYRKKETAIDAAVKCCAYQYKISEDEARKKLTVYADRSDYFAANVGDYHIFGREITEAVEKEA